jgi:hypothetical protein
MSVVSRSLVFSVFCGVIFTGFDMFHTWSGAVRYLVTWPAPLLLREAWWVPLLFGATVGPGGPAYALAYRRLGGKRRPPAWLLLALGLVAFGSLYCASGFLPVGNAAMLGVLAAGALLLWIAFDRTWQGAALAVVSAAAGTCTEMVLTRLGLFVHLRADAFGVPIWLPGLYACGAPVLGHAARRWLAM